MKYFAGCDVGSTYTKAVILDENGVIVDAVTVVLKDGQGNYYQPIYIPVPNYFK